MDSNLRSRRERDDRRERPAADHRRFARRPVLDDPIQLIVRHFSSATAERPFTRAGPMVRIRFPPAESPQTIGSSAVASERKLVGLIPLRLLRGLNDVGGRSSLGRQQGRSAPAALDRPILYLFLAKRAALHLRLFPQAISPGCNVVSLIIRYLSRHSPDFGPLP